jgi:hypothetical protein
MLPQVFPQADLLYDVANDMIPALLDLIDSQNTRLITDWSVIK